MSTGRHPTEKTQLLTSVVSLGEQMRYVSNLLDTSEEAYVTHLLAVWCPALVCVCVCVCVCVVCYKGW